MYRSGHLLNIVDVHRETPDSVVLTLIPETAADADDSFDFEAGQHLVLSADIDGEAVHRSYSICSCPGEGLKVGIREVAGGRFSTWANRELCSGMSLYAEPPAGVFTWSALKSPPRNILAIVSGSGITPVLSLISSVLQQSSDSTVSLIYGNRSRASMMFAKQLNQLKDKYLQRFNAAYVFSREQNEQSLFNGHIDRGKIEQFIHLMGGIGTFDCCLLCGIPEMTAACHEVLLDMGMSEDNILTEHFVTSEEDRQKIQSKKRRRQQTFGEGAAAVTVKLRSRSTQFSLAKNGDSILDGALQAGADLPFACKGGMCCTCRAKLVNGEVEMDLNYGLRKEEVEAGFILTCQSHPLSDTVEIDFDQR